MLWGVYYVILSLWLYDQRTHALCLVSDCMLTKFNLSYFYMFIPLYINIYTIHNKHTHKCHRQDSFSFAILKQFYLKYLQSSQKSTPTISYNMWPHVFRYWLYITCFWLRIYFRFCFLLYEVFSHLIQIQESVGIQRKLIPGWIKPDPARIRLIYI